MNVIHFIGSNKIIFISIQISLQKNYFFRFIVFLLSSIKLIKFKIHNYFHTNLYLK